MKSVCCSIQREVDIYVAMIRARELATALGFQATDRSRIEIVALELSRNLLVHAYDGTLAFRHLEDNQRGLGLAVEACDTGPGIADIGLALQDGYSTTRTLGAGLPGVRRLMDEFSIESSLGTGTCVRVVKWRIPLRRRVMYGC